MHDETENCPNCGEPMIEIIENNGFTPPDPVHYDLVGFECTECGHREDL